MKVLTAIAATALLSVASLAIADEAHACGGGRKIMKLDANGDGKVTRAEMTDGMVAKAKERMATVDANKDGVVDAKEREAMKAAHPDRKVRGEQHMARVDANKDGRVDTKEIEGAVLQRVARMMERFDANNDGVIEQSELKGGRHGHEGKGA